MADVTISYNYYEDPTNLKLVMKYHKDHGEVDGIHFTIIDDASPTKPINLKEVPDWWSVYRIKDDVGWNNEGAKNLAMDVSHTEWNLIGDADHPVKDKSVRMLPDLVDTLDPNTAYRPVRTGGKPRGVNCFLLTKTLFWKAGGYDETYQGLYGYDCTLDWALRETATLENHFDTIELDSIHDGSILNRAEKQRQNDEFWAMKKKVDAGEIEKDPRRCKFRWEQIQ